MSSLIREAIAKDAPILTAAEQETAESPGLLVSRPHELTVESFETKIAELSKVGRYIVAEKDDAIVGHALLGPLPLEAIAHVFRLTIVVHPGFRGQGIGEALMRDLMDWVQQTPRAGKIELLVRSTNVRAIRLYEKLGFIEEGRFRKRISLPNGSFIDDIAMAWVPNRRQEL